MYGEREAARMKSALLAMPPSETTARPLLLVCAWTNQDDSSSYVLTNSLNTLLFWISDASIFKASGITWTSRMDLLWTDVKSSHCGSDQAVPPGTNSWGGGCRSLHRQRWKVESHSVSYRQIGVHTHIKGPERVRDGKVTAMATDPCWRMMGW